MKQSQSGAYMILNKVSGTRYVGSTTRAVSERFGTHRYKLRHGIHGNPYLQSDWNKYGEQAFAFILLENCPPEHVFEREAHWYAILKKQGHRLYNLKPGGQNSQFGFKHSEATKKQISISNTGKAHKMTPRGLANIRKATSRPRPDVAQRFAKPFSFVSPDGTAFTGTNLLEFCQRRGLDLSAMAKVNKGHRPSHKGWRKHP